MLKPTRHQIIFINGPRHSGKDTAVQFALREFPNSRHRKFAAPLKAGVAAAFALDERLVKSFEAIGSTDKLLPRPELMGMSWVEALIWYSEEVMKPKFGNDIYGRIMRTELLKTTSAPFTMISDSGFIDEVLPVVHAFGSQNCHVFRLMRPKHSFDGDSRSYIYPEEHFNNFGSAHDIENRHELSMFKLQILTRMCKILGIERSAEVLAT